MDQNRLTKGDTFIHNFEFSQDDVNSFAKTTGDLNPIHLDEEYAKNTVFKSPIVHGFLGGSVFSKVFGTLWPGEGTIYLKQELKFVKPMRTNTQYKAVFRILEVFEEKNRALVETTIFEKDSPVIEGQALIMSTTRI